MCIVNQERELNAGGDGQNTVDEDVLENWI